MPNALCLLNSCRTSDAGVMGYEPRNKDKPLFSAAAISPYAKAWLPITDR
jgi:hypothetical protein